MALPLIGTVVVQSNGITCNWTGATLTSANCNEGYPVVINKEASFVASLDSVDQFTLAIAVTPGSTLACAISPLNPQQVQIATLNARVVQLLNDFGHLGPTGISVNAFGSYSERSTYDDETVGFAFLSLNGDGTVGSPQYIYLKDSNVSADWNPTPVEVTGGVGPAPNMAIGTVSTLDTGEDATASVTGTNPNYSLNLGLPKGAKGDRGWAIEPALITDGSRRVIQVAGYVGGEGTEPTDNVNYYVGVSGLTNVLASAIDIRGDEGPTGPIGITWMGAWDSGTNYVAKDVVTDPDSDGEPAAWVAKTDNTNSQPKDNPSDWDFFPGSFPATLDDGLITDIADVTLDDGLIV